VTDGSRRKVYKSRWRKDQGQTHHDTGLTGTTDKGGEDGPGSIISGETSCELKKGIKERGHVRY